MNNFQQYVNQVTWNLQHLIQAVLKINIPILTYQFGYAQIQAKVNFLVVLIT